MKHDVTESFNFNPNFSINVEPLLSAAKASRDKYHKKYYRDNDERDENLKLIITKINKFFEPFLQIHDEDMDMGDPSSGACINYIKVIDVGKHIFNTLYREQHIPLTLIEEAAENIIESRNSNDPITKTMMTVECFIDVAQCHEICENELYVEIDNDVDVDVDVE